MSSPCTLDLLKDVYHLTIAPMICLKGLVVLRCSHFVGEEEAARLPNDAIWCRFEDDCERLDPAQLLFAEPDRYDFLQLSLSPIGGVRRATAGRRSRCWIRND